MKVLVYYQIYTVITFYSNVDSRGNQSYLRNIQEACYGEWFQRKQEKIKGIKRRKKKDKIEE